MSQSPSPLRVGFLRAEYLVDPLGLDAAAPRLSWLVEAEGRGVVQSACQVLAATSEDALARDEGDLWDSGRVASAETAQVVYGGTPIAPRQRAWWKVRVWDGNGAASAWSEPAFWERGFGSLIDWRGTWISLPGIAPDTTIPEAAELDALLPVSTFRRAFTVDGEVVRARLTVTARGVYEARLNGTRVGDQVLAPGWTDYNSRTQVQTFDVTDRIVTGENALGAMVGSGWFAGYVGFEPGARHYGTVPQLLAQLEIDLADGSRQVIATDPEWRTATGPIRYSDFLMGEYHDARLDTPGWDAPGFDDAGWMQPQIQNRNGVPLVGDSSEPVRALDEIAPIARTEPSPGTWIFDLGQNIAGWVRLKASGPSGTTIRMRFAEILNTDGTIYVTNLRSARATDTFILRGEGEETFEPHFTWHGFRYVEVTGFPGEPGLDAITGVFVGSDTRPVGTFACSDDLVNQLQRNIVWGQRDNFLSIPTDCPQRDERLGWLGDAQVFVGTAVGNMDVAAFFTKWMQDVVDAQSPAGVFPDVAPLLVDLREGAPAWADCGIIVPWTIWKTYGDTGIITRHWAAMERYLDWLVAENPNLLWQNGRHNDFGDWLSIAADTNKELIGTAYMAYDAGLMSAMAAAIGREHDANRYWRLHEDIAAAFCAAYVQEDGTIAGDTQTAYVLALHFNLLPDDQRPVAAKRLVDDIAAKGGHLSTGFVGVSYLCHVLTEHGYPEVAYQLLQQTTFPSWKYSILHGATTIWERWDGWTEEKGFQDPGMNSFNHYSLGSVGEWLRRRVAGIDNAPGETGYRRLRIAPVLDDSLTWAEGSYESIRGTIRTRWERSADGLTLALTVPANVTAEVVIPGVRLAEVTEGGIALADAQGVTSARQDGDDVVATVGSGSYSFAGR
ncbi:MAG: glycoside hydrolase family 78 protein [Thermomicrobiales bacterium]